ncbi:MAG: 4-hydroxybutyrate CoA-transferase [Chloroflexi bacterium]|nr:MAG: 4-hydroxybutyrate CoA-transferase [Chloroflexota bacterium]RLC96248.1 MAG: 4-hydroxybutyrate CoA-transferase [Chloroflexota bacterium]
MDWREEYKKRLVSPEEALKAVKSGDYVVMAQPEALALGLALVSRADELSGVRIMGGGGSDLPMYDPSWYDVYPDAFQLETSYVLPLVRALVNQKKSDFTVSGLYAVPDTIETKPIDVVMVQVSPPDEHGFCSFGASLWKKKEWVREARTVLAEVNERMIRTYGDNFVHVSEIDYFVEHTPTGKVPGGTDILGRRSAGPGELEKTIAGYVGTLVRDGDCLEIGVGGTAEWVAQLGDLESKHDLGWHSENTVRGIGSLVMSGVINGKRKNIHQGKAVATAVGGGTKEEMDFINNNPLFEVYSSTYVLDPRVIASHDNMVAINSAIAVDLTGQIAAESVGPVMTSGSGGQLSFAIGAYLSKGGRSIVAIPSTAREGSLSRIVPMLEPGTVVSTPRTLADIVVTEHGIARLKGKTQRERALELIGVAHPDFRAELKKEAERLYWP